MLFANPTSSESFSCWCCYQSIKCLDGPAGGSSLIFLCSKNACKYNNLQQLHDIRVSALRVTAGEKFDEAVAGKFRFGMVDLEGIVFNVFNIATDAV